MIAMQEGHYALKDEWVVVLDEFWGTCAKREHMEIKLADTEDTGELLKEINTSSYTQ